jgi:REP element-mobilizing transposase RayT
MPQTLSCIYLHIVFSTKNRVGFLKGVELRKKMHAYLAGIAANHGCPAVRMGGVADHVHILVRMGREITQSDLLRELKRSSSVWVKKQSEHHGDFAWQNGAGLFSVSPGHIDDVCRYIDNQELHHHETSFQDEARKIFTKYGIKWDENYVWE